MTRGYAHIYKLRFLYLNISHRKAKKLILNSKASQAYEVERKRKKENKFSLLPYTN